MRSAIVIISGGLDSTVLLYKLLSEKVDVAALSVDYGQRHKKEIGFAERTCAKLGVEHRIAQLDVLRPLLAGSSQTSDDIAVPHGHYEEENMKLTVVPNRNMLMLSVALAWAISTKREAVAYAAHCGDHAIYPDCRPEFVEALGKAAMLADWHPVSLVAPFLGTSKAGIVELGAQLGVPFEETWSCYEGGEKHCGKCGTCVERQEAFDLAGVVDPTPYDE